MRDKEEIRAHMHRLLDIVLDGNGFEARSRKKTGTLPTLFMEFAGHCDLLTVRMCTDGWDTGAYSDKDWDIHTSEINQNFVDRVQAAVQEALTDKTETDVLRRDILRQEGKVKDEKDTLALMKRTLKRKERHEKAAAGTTTDS